MAKVEKLVTMLVAHTEIPETIVMDMLRESAEGKGIVLEALKFEKSETCLCPQDDLWPGPHWHYRQAFMALNEDSE